MIVTIHEFRDYTVSPEIIYLIRKGICRCGLNSQKCKIDESPLPGWATEEITTDDITNQLLDIHLHKMLTEECACFKDP